MASRLLKQQGGSSILGAVSAFNSMSGGDPQAMYDYMYRSNPDFRQFADSVRGKTPEQAFREHGIDFAQVRGLMR